VSVRTVVGACHLLHRFRIRNRWVVAWTALTGMLLSLTSAGLSAQELAERRMSLTPQLGVATPILGFGDYANGGLSLGVRFTYPVSGDIHAVVDGGWNRFAGAPVATEFTPQMSRRHLTIGVMREAAPPETRPVFLSVGAGAGIVSFDSEPFQSRITNEELTFSYLYPVVSAGVEMGYALTESLAIVGGLKLDWIFTKEEHTREIDLIGPPSLIRSIESAQVVPMVVGLRIKI